MDNPVIQTWVLMAMAVIAGFLFARLTKLHLVAVTLLTALAALVVQIVAYYVTVGPNVFHPNGPMPIYMMISGLTVIPALLGSVFGKLLKQGHEK